jgi:oxygen-independent coproporphyrinogen-3 oxidase
MDSLGLYIQVPFCASKCSFCNFSSRVAHRDVYGRYCQAVARELECLPDFYRAGSIAENVFEVPVDSAYIGGGTPSLLGPVRLEQLVAGIRQRFQFASEPEVTIEVTPGSADPDFLQRIRTLGINRLSIGAQSFSDIELRSVGRLHSAEDTRALVQTARAQGFPNISLDLIAGLPHQTEASWLESLQSVISLRPEHVSIYLFEVDEKSRLGSEVLKHGVHYHAGALPDEDFVAGAYDRARKSLLEAGYIQYEISNYALPGRESRHNRRYWRLQPYVGLGAGAHSCDGQSRWENVTSVGEYENRLEIGQSPICERHILTTEAQVEEFFFLGLRQTSGVNLAEAADRWGGEHIARWTERLNSLEHDGWLERRDGRVRLADRALLISNEIFQEFVSA